MNIAYDRFGEELMTEFSREFFLKFMTPGEPMVLFKSRSDYEQDYKAYQDTFFAEGLLYEPEDLIEYKRYLRGDENALNQSLRDIPKHCLLILMLEMDLEEIPLYTNSILGYVSFVSKWRLTVGI